MTLADILRSQISESQIAVSMKDASALLQISESSVKRLVRTGELPSRKIGARRLIAVESLRALFS